MTINEKMTDPGPLVYYEKGFLDVLEAHLEYLRKNRETVVFNILPQDNIIYYKDLFGYLTHLKVPNKLHWIIMRMNAMYSTHDFIKSHTTLLVPNETVVDKIKQGYITKNNSL